MAVKNWIYVLFLMVPTFINSALSGDNPDSIFSKKNSAEPLNLVDADSIAIKVLLEQTKGLYKESPTKGIVLINQIETELSKNPINPFKGEVLLIKGGFYWNVGIYNIALNNYFEALSYFERVNNIDQVIRVLNNIGETYKKQNNYILAQQFLRTAIRKSLNNSTDDYLLIQVNVAQLHLLMNQADSALSILYPIIKNTPQNEANSNVMGYAFLYAGVINTELEKYDTAAYYLHKSLSIWESNKLYRNKAETLAELGKLAISQQNFKKARNLLLLAELDASKSQALDILMRIYEYRIDLLEYSSREDSLSYFYKKYISIKDSIYNEASRKEINKLTIQYELLEKEKDNYKLALEQEKLKNLNQNQSSLLIVLFIILIIAVTSIYLQVKKRIQLSKAHADLKLQKADIEAKQKQLSRKSLELANVNQELYNLNRTLEQKVIDRSEQLNIKNKQIAEYTFYNSHKLRAPVASILGLINVLELNKEGKVDEGLLEHLKTCALELDEVIHRLKVLLDNELIEELISKNK